MEFDNFDASTIEPSAPREVIPAGWYKAVIVKSEEKPTKSMTGSYLQLRIEIIEGPHKGIVLIDRLNLNNPNDQAVDIAMRTLSAICHAVKVMRPRNERDLHDKPMMIKVKVKPASNGYEASNEISGYAEVSKGQSSEAPEQTGGRKAPWGGR